MDANATAALGEDVLVQAVVQTSGTSRSMMRAGIAGSVGGVVGSMAGGVIGGRGRHTELLGHKGRMFLLLGPTRLGFFQFKQGLLKPSVGGVIGILRRDAVTSIEIGSGMLATGFTVHLDDGTALVLEAPRTERGKIEKASALIGTRPSVPPPPIPDAPAS